MKTKLLLTALLCAAAASSAQTTYNWQGAVSGSMDNAALWSPAGFTPANAQMIFGVNGTYQVGLQGDMSSRYVILRGNSGTVTFDLGAHQLNLSSIFQVNQNTQITSGQIQGTVQVGSFASNKVLTVTGGNAVLNSASGAFLGRNDSSNAGSGNQINVNNGATFNGAGSLTIGDNRGGAATSNNVLTVSGTNTTFTAGSVAVGNLSTSDSAAEANNNRLTVTDGASAQLSSLTIGRRAGGVTSTAIRGNQVAVGGGSGTSTMTVTGAVNIGNNGADNVFRVDNGGVVTASGGGTNINSGTGNALIIDGGSYLATGQKVTVYGTSHLALSDGGSLEAGNLDLRAALNTVGKANLELDTLTLSDIATINIEINSATDYAQIQIYSATEAFVFNGSFTLAFADGYQAIIGTQFQLFSFSSATGQFSTIDLPELAAGLQWDIDSFYRTGTLTVVPEASSYAMSIAALGLLGGLAFRKRFSSK